MESCWCVQLFIHSSVQLISVFDAKNLRGQEVIDPSLVYLHSCLQMSSIYEHSNTYTHRYTQIRAHTHTHKCVHLLIWLKPTGSGGKLTTLTSSLWDNFNDHVVERPCSGLREPLYSDTTTYNALQWIRNWHVTWPDNLPLPVGGAWIEHCK